MDFNIANSLERNSIFVVMVLNILVIPTSDITIINPYKNIENNTIIERFCSYACFKLFKSYFTKVAPFSKFLCISSGLSH